jgi:hypothetical protein
MGKHLDSFIKIMTQTVAHNEVTMNMIWWSFVTNEIIFKAYIYMYICMKKLNGDINIHTSSKDIHFYVDSGTKGQLLLNII